MTHCPFIRQPPYTKFLRSNSSNTSQVALLHYDSRNPFQNHLSAQHLLCQSSSSFARRDLTSYLPTLSLQSILIHLAAVICSHPGTIKMDTDSPDSASQLSVPSLPSLGSDDSLRLGNSPIGKSARSKKTGTPFRIQELWIYPIKSVAGIRVEEAKMTTTGLQCDRQWMFVEEHGSAITSTEAPTISRMRTRFVNDGQDIELRSPVRSEVLILPAFPKWRYHSSELKIIPIEIAGTYGTAFDFSSSVRKSGGFALALHILLSLRVLTGVPFEQDPNRSALTGISPGPPVKKGHHGLLPGLFHELGTTSTSGLPSGSSSRALNTYCRVSYHEFRLQLSHPNCFPRVS